MPFDPTVAVVFGTLLTALLACLMYAAWYQQLKHSKKAHEAADYDAPNSMGVSELEELIRKTVEEATRPLTARLRVVEQEVQALGGVRKGGTQPALPEPKGAQLLTSDDQDVFEESERDPSRVRVR